MHWGGGHTRRAEAAGILAAALPDIGIACGGGGPAAAAAAVAGSASGAWQHAEENRAAGPLDFRYASEWGSMSTGEQWWKAATKAVGPAPVLGFTGMPALASTFPPVPPEGRRPVRR